MKNFAVILISIIILSVFIAFNYVLWDRESLVNQNVSNTQDIENLKLDNTELLTQKYNLEKEVRSLTQKVIILEKESQDKTNAFTEIEEQLAELQTTTKVFKSQMDALILRDIVLLWFNDINNKMYADSFEYFLNDALFFNEHLLLYEYKSLFEDIVDNLELTSFEILKDSMDIDYYVPAVAVINVTLTEGAESKVFKAGENNLNIKFEYLEEEQKWFIVEINEHNTNKEDTISD